MRNRDFERKQRVGPGQQRVPIPDLDKKLGYIPSFFNLPQTLSKLSEICGVPRQTLDDAAKAEAMKTSTAGELQAGLNAKGFKFSIKWVEWRDPAGHGRDAFEKLAAKLQAENASFVPPQFAQGEASRSSPA